MPINPKIIIILVVIAAFIGGGLYWNGIQKQRDIQKSEGEKATGGVKQTMQTQVKTAPVDTSTWKTYRNEKYGFEVKYPADLVFWKNPDLPIFEFGTPKDVGVSIIMGPAPNDSVSWMALRLESDKFSNRRKIKDINIGLSTKGILVETCGKLGEDCILSADFIKDKYSYRITESKMYPYFEQILSTFKFIEPTSDVIKKPPLTPPPSPPISTENSQSGIAVNVFCIDKIYEKPCAIGGIIVKTSDGKEVARHNADSSGFKVSLEPGDYLVLPMPGNDQYPLINSEPTKVQVELGKFAEHKFYYWDGKR